MRGLPLQNLSEIDLYIYVKMLLLSVSGKYRTVFYIENMVIYLYIFTYIFSFRLMDVDISVLGLHIFSECKELIGTNTEMLQLGGCVQGNICMHCGLAHLCGLFVI